MSAVTTMPSSRTTPAGILLCAAIISSCSQPPHYVGRFWCFVSAGAYGTKLDSPDADIASIQRNGEPVTTCICFCNQLHADSQLFLAEDNPPPPSDEWLEKMDAYREVAVQRCQDRAVELGLVNDNCDEATPDFPTWMHQDYKCRGRPHEQGAYCTEPDGGRAEDTGGDGDETGESPAARPR